MATEEVTLLVMRAFAILLPISLVLVAIDSARRGPERRAQKRQEKDAHRVAQGKARRRPMLEPLPEGERHPYRSVLTSAPRDRRRP